MTEPERIRELEAESEPCTLADPCWMSPEEAEFWERVEAEFP